MQFFRSRALHTLKTHVKTLPLVQEESVAFKKVFPLLVKKLASTGEELINKQMIKLLERNVLNSNANRGMTVLSSYKALETPEKLTSENLRLASILGWCLEINQSALLIKDDVYDASEIRRGSPCWYKAENLNMSSAFNDSVLLEYGVFHLLKQYFSFYPCYAKFTECFHELALVIAMGEILETIFVKEGRTNINTFTRAKYDTLISYKTEPYVFLTPVNLAFHLAEKLGQKRLEPILREMAHLVQATNDYLDCFGDPTDTGKIGTDIKEGKFSWLITTALERATPAQNKLLSENYGKDCAEAVWKVKQVYDELDMRGVFGDYEKRKLEFIKLEIEKVSLGFPHKSFLEYLASIVEPNYWKEKEWWKF